MWKTRILAAMVVVSAVLTVSVLAQQQANVTLRSGERFAGDLVGFNGSDYTFRVSGRERRVSSNDVAAVELSGARALSNGQQAQLADGHPFVMLKSGEVVDGRLYRISQIFAQPLRIVVDTPSGQRPFSVNDVAGIYVAKPADLPVATGGRAARNRWGGGRQNGRGNTIVIPGNQQWVPTNISVRTGEVLHFQASGQVQFSPDPEDRAEAQGAPKRHTVAGSPVPSQPGGSLIGRIDNGQPFWIGNQSAVSMPADGILYVGINDDNVLDNAGQFNIVIGR